MALFKSCNTPRQITESDTLLSKLKRSYSATHELKWGLFFIFILPLSGGVALPQVNPVDVLECDNAYRSGGNSSDHIWGQFGTCHLRQYARRALDSMNELPDVPLTHLPISTPPQSTIDRNFWRNRATGATHFTEFNDYERHFATDVERTEPWPAGNALHACNFRSQLDNSDPNGDLELFIRYFNFYGRGFRPESDEYASSAGTFTYAGSSVGTLTDNAANNNQISTDERNNLLIAQGAEVILFGETWSFFNNSDIPLQSYQEEVYQGQTLIDSIITEWAPSVNRLPSSSQDQRWLYMSLDGLNKYFDPPNAPGVIGYTNAPGYGGRPAATTEHVFNTWMHMGGAYAIPDDIRTTFPIDNTVRTPFLLQSRVLDGGDSSQVRLASGAQWAAWLEPDFLRSHNTYKTRPDVMYGLFRQRFLEHEAKHNVFFMPEGQQSQSLPGRGNRAPDLIEGYLSAEVKPESFDEVDAGSTRTFTRHLAILPRPSNNGRELSDIPALATSKRYTGPNIWDRSTNATRRDYFDDILANPRFQALLDLQYNYVRHNSERIGDVSEWYPFPPLGSNPDYSRFIELFAGIMPLHPSESNFTYDFYDDFTLVGPYSTPFEVRQNFGYYADCTFQALNPYRRAIVPRLTTKFRPAANLPGQDAVLVGDITWRTDSNNYIEFQTPDLSDWEFPALRIPWFTEQDHRFLMTLQHIFPLNKIQAPQPVNDDTTANDIRRGLVRRMQAVDYVTSDSRNWAQSYVTQNKNDTDTDDSFVGVMLPTGTVDEINSWAELVPDTIESRSGTPPPTLLAAIGLRRCVNPALDAIDAFGVGDQRRVMSILDIERQLYCAYQATVEEVNAFPFFSESARQLDYIITVSCARIPVWTLDHINNSDSHAIPGWISLYRIHVAAFNQLANEQWLNTNTLTPIRKSDTATNQYIQTAVTHEMYLHRMRINPETDDFETVSPVCGRFYNVALQPYLTEEEWANTNLGQVDSGWILDNERQTGILFNRFQMDLDDYSAIFHGTDLATSIRPLYHSVSHGSVYTNRHALGSPNDQNRFLIGFEPTGHLSYFNNVNPDGTPQLTPTITSNTGGNSQELPCIYYNYKYADERLSASTDSAENFPDLETVAFTRAANVGTDRILNVIALRDPSHINGYLARMTSGSPNLSGSNWYNQVEWQSIVYPYPPYPSSNSGFYRLRTGGVSVIDSTDFSYALPAFLIPHNFNSGTRRPHANHLARDGTGGLRIFNNSLSYSGQNVHLNAFDSAGTQSFNRDWPILWPMRRAAGGGATLRDVFDHNRPDNAPVRHGGWWAGGYASFHPGDSTTTDISSAGLRSIQTLGARNGAWELARQIANPLINYPNATYIHTDGNSLPTFGLPHGMEAFYHWRQYCNPNSSTTREGHSAMLLSVLGAADSDTRAFLPANPTYPLVAPDLAANINISSAIFELMRVRQYCDARLAGPPASPSCQVASSSAVTNGYKFPEEE